MRHTEVVANQMEKIMTNNIQFAFASVAMRRMAGFVRVDIFYRDMIEVIGPMEWIFGGSPFESCMVDEPPAPAFNS